MNIVIIGSSTGIGRAVAEHLLAQDHQVWGAARSDQSDFAAGHRENFRASRCDVAQWNQVEAMAREVGDAWTHVDGLVICAAVQYGLRNMK